MLTLHDAVALLTRAAAAAAEMGISMSLAVVDAGGHLLAFHRMDGAPWISAEVAQGKAFTAAAYRASTAEQRTKAESLPRFATALTAMTGGRYVPQTGGLPIVRDGECVGGVGASGGTGEQDEQVCATALQGGDR
ncbi:MAG: GlcG/HbpS family heme-binding protein [Mycobacteriales bacterium]